MAAKPEPDEKSSLVTMHSSLPEGLTQELGQYAGAGVSDRASDFAMPFLMIAQKGSAQVNKREVDKFIPGLEVGDIFNTATGEYWRASEGVLVVQSWFQKAMVEWIPRSDGGGWIATHPIDTPLMKLTKPGGQDNREMRLPNGHQLVDTSYHFVALADTSELAVVSMTATSLGASRQWQTLMKRIKIPVSGQLVVAPSFSRVFRLKTAYKSNEKGDWFVYVINDEGWAAGHAEYNDAYLTARAHFVEASTKGVQMGRPPESEGSHDGATVDAHVDPDVPF